ncbi:MAG TPA: LysO family transporter [Spirochaetota bacterium]|nr:LysO family transporter [Spirochaetota bacterium]
MFFVILSMTAGIAVGFFFRKKYKAAKIADKLTGGVIYILLFSLGLSVGANEKIVKNIGNLGLKALIISVSAILGSMIFSFFVYRFFFKDKNNDR